MNKNLLIYLTFVGLIGLLSDCKKDEMKVIISANPIAPTILTLPDLTLKRASGKDTLIFTGTAVDPGFQASATYFLEACAKGNNFKDSISIANGISPQRMKITVSELNGLLLKKFPADQVSTVDFRIRAVLSIDAGTGYKPMIYSSAAKSADVTIYGLPRLDLIGSGITQKIESALGDGTYTGFVKLDKTKAFTIKDPDSGTIYGANGTALAVNGTALTPSENGWFQLSADTKGLTLKLDLYKIGLVGSATLNGWNGPDQPFDYNAQTGIWSCTTTLVSGVVKVRKNNDWNQGINLGLGDATHTQYNLSNLWNNGGSKDIPIADAGNYTMQLSIGSSTYSMTITKNN
jgi:hypothetical protein